MAFVPRLSTTIPTQMLGNPWWYSSGNPYYGTQYEMPNCTAYTCGRVGEENGYFKSLPGGNGGDWWNNGIAMGLPHGYQPQLGGIMCYYDPDGIHDGHVCVVEIIDPNTGEVTTSNSGYQSPRYFWLDTVSPQGNYVDTADNWLINRNYVYQGCLYVLDNAPPTPVYHRKHKMPVWMMLRYN